MTPVQGKVTPTNPSLNWHTFYSLFFVSIRLYDYQLNQLKWAIRVHIQEYIIKYFLFDSSLDIEEFYKADFSCDLSIDIYNLKIMIN